MFGFFKKIGKALGRRSLNTAVNIDRTVASAVLGTPEDETISGWSGMNKKKDPVADALATSLDAVHFGGDPHHAEDAAKADAFIVDARDEYEGKPEQFPNAPEVPGLIKKQ